MNNLKKNVLFSLLLIIVLSERLFFDLGANVQLISSASLVVLYFLGKKESLLFAILSLIISDLIIGNSLIFIFTWSGFLIPLLLLNNTAQKRPFLNLIVKGFGINTFFFLWTNFGVFITDIWGMYPNNIGGLIRCYMNALPFYRNDVVGSLVSLPVLFFAAYLVRLYPNKRTAFNIKKALVPFK